MLRIRDIAILILLALLLGQGALLVHKVTSDHLSDDTCEVCTTHDRPIAAIAVPTVGAFALLFCVLNFGRKPSLDAKRRVASTRARGPPLL